MKPKVTIGICMRNCEATIKEALEGIVDQDFPHELMEVIFVDDGSEDRTLSIVLDSVSRMDMQTKVYHQEWRGLGLVRKVVVDNADGDYIIWVDGDIRLSRAFVKKLVAFMEQNPRVGIAQGIHGIRPCCHTKIVTALENITWVAVGLKYRGVLTSKLPGTGGSIYRVKAIRQVCGFDEAIEGAGEDQEAAYRVREAGWLLYLLAEAIFYEIYRGKKGTWKALWDHYFWYGYSAYSLHFKNKNIITLYKMSPPAAFLTGLLLSSVVYPLTRRKAVFLLPLHYTFKRIAWCLGFVKSHWDSYGLAKDRVQNRATL